MDALSKDSDILLRLLSASALRQRVLAANVANQNVPGYRRREVVFEDHLRQELERGRTPDRLAIEVVTDPGAPANADGNTVQLEDELSAMRENRLLYEMYANLLSGRFRMMRSAIHSDR